MWSTRAINVLFSWEPSTYLKMYFFSLTLSYPSGGNLTDGPLHLGKYELPPSEGDPWNKCRAFGWTKSQSRNELLQPFISLIKIISWKMWILFCKLSDALKTKQWGSISIKILRDHHYSKQNEFAPVFAEDAVVAAPPLTGKSGKKAQLPHGPQQPFLLPHSTAQHLAAFVCALAQAQQRTQVVLISPAHHWCCSKLPMSCLRVQVNLILFT